MSRVFLSHDRDKPSYRHFNRGLRVARFRPAVEKAGKASPV